MDKPSFETQLLTSWFVSLGKLLNLCEVFFLNLQDENIW